MLLSGKAQGQTLACKRNAPCAPFRRSCSHGHPGRGAFIVRSAVVPPSQVTAANELDSLSRLSTIVPDTLAFESVNPEARLAAASVSASTLRSVLLGESLGHKPYENAIVAALSAGRSGATSPLSDTPEPLDRAMVNVGAMLAGAVSGRVETVVDPRLANDAAAMVAKVRTLSAAYEALRVPRNRLVYGVPATWAGTRAAQTLESEGIATSIYLVYGMAQGVAAMQAGASVLRVAVSRIRDWYDKNPGVIRNPHGPREDSGARSSYDPAIQLVKDLYCYSRRFHPKTAIMASSLRTRSDALDLAGCDYLVLSGRLISQLTGVATDQGYNDGLSAVGGSTGVDAALTPKMAEEADVHKWEPVSEEAWRSGLGLAASQLLASSLAARVADVEELDRLLAARASASL